jgi:hypothetical protein
MFSSRAGASQISNGQSCAAIAPDLPLAFGHGVKGVRACTSGDGR